MKVVSTVLPNKTINEQITAKFPQVDFRFYKNIEKAQSDFSDADIFITFGNDLTEELIYSAERLKWIMVMSAGVEEIPLLACQEKGIIITNAKGIHKTPMSEFVLGLMLQHEKKLNELWQYEQKSMWERKLNFGELNGKTILLLGTGAIGEEIARLAKAFNMETVGVNRSGRKVNYFDEVVNINYIDTVLPKADYFVSVLPSTSETKYLLKETHFKLMKETAVFCNVGRGDLVQESVLLKALKKGEIAHAFLDVFENEPLDSDHPFWEMDNITITPHVSSITENYLPRGFEIFIKNLTLTLKDKSVRELINRIDVSRGY